MGCIFRKKKKQSKGEGATSSENIDRNLKIDGLKNTLNIKLLILGSGETGKSTVLKQIKMIHKIELKAEELQAIVASLRRNAIQCMQILIEQAETFGYTLDNEQNNEKAEKIRELDLDDLESAGPEAAELIVNLFADSGIQKTFERRSEFWIMEAAQYFFENSPRFMDPYFEPSEDDIVMARVITIGINQTEINYAPLVVTLFDVGGQRNERKKWLQCFDNVNGIIFLCNLAGYNSVLYEDNTVNRMAECLTLFKQTVNNPLFEKTPFYLLFNKKDMFEEKLRKMPITACECFKDYSGPPSDTGQALQYIESVFRAQITNSDPKRLMVFNIAARFKRDVKTCWDDIINDIRLRYKVQINSAVKQLAASS